MKTFPSLLLISFLSLSCLQAKVVSTYFTLNGNTLTGEGLHWELPSGSWGNSVESPRTEGLDITEFYEIYSFGIFRFEPSVTLLQLMLYELSSNPPPPSLLEGIIDSQKNIGVFDEWLMKYTTEFGYQAEVVSQQSRTDTDWTTKIYFTDNQNVADSNFWAVVSFSSENRVNINEVKKYTDGFKFKKSFFEIDDAQNTSSSNSLESVFSFVDKGNNWGESSWFGYCWNKPDSNWIFHSLLKWLYVHVNEDGSVWLYSNDLNGIPFWLWTSPNHFPYLFIVPAGVSVSLGYWAHLDINSGLIRKWSSNAWSMFIDLVEKDDSDTSSTNSSDNNTASTFDSNNPPSDLTINLNSSTQFEMLWVEPGTFTTGSPTTEIGRSSDETQNQVTLSHGFYLGKYEVTQVQYEAVMVGNTDGLSATPSSYSGNPNRPVERVSWEDAQIFLSRLNSQQSANVPVGWKYVLPTEAQWEYACRAGTTTAYSWGNDINSTRANYNWDGGANDGNDFKQTRDVGQYSANPWGFFDMHGNVSEWTADSYGSYSSTSVIDPQGSASGLGRVMRGGSWASGEARLRSGKRGYSYSPGSRSFTDTGFRVAFQTEGSVTKKNTGSVTEKYHGIDFSTVVELIISSSKNDEEKKSELGKYILGL